MVSGVGPADQLKAHGIPVVKDLPGVGSHLVDHCVFDVAFKDAHNDSALFLKPKNISDVFKLVKAVVQYRILGSGGPLAMNVSSFFRLGELS